MFIMAGWVIVIFVVIGTVALIQTVSDAPKKTNLENDVILVVIMSGIIWWIITAMSKIGGMS